MNTLQIVRNISNKNLPYRFINPKERHIQITLVVPPNKMQVIKFD